MKYSHIISYVVNTPWAILPTKLQAILGALLFQAGGGKLSDEEIALIVGAASRPGAIGGQGVAVLPLLGTIYQRAEMLSESSGGTSTQRFAQMFRQAVADNSVGAIVIDVDSPGGSVSGVDELSTEIHRARGTKPIVAVANSLAASAAYWIASAADELVVTPSGEVGSIGVVAVHEDYSKALETEGVKATLITAGKYKGEGSPYEALGEEARGAIQSRVDEYYLAFTKAVARNRGRPLAEVRGGFGEGRVVGARKAAELGMADSVGTLEETIARLASKRRQAQQARAEADIDMRRRRLRLAGE